MKDFIRDQSELQGDRHVSRHLDDDDLGWTGLPHGVTIIMAYATYTFFEGELVTVMHEGRRRDVATDPQGSVVHLMTSFFVLSDSLTYWPYGEQRTKSGGINIPFHYAGAHGYYEDTSNRLYVRARYYRADLGNWITKDPLWPEEKAYQYVNGNPTNYVDPNGMSAKEILKCAKEIVEDKEIRGKYITDNDVKWPCRKTKDEPKRYTDCGYFVATCARLHDPNYPRSGTSIQGSYVIDGKSTVVVQENGKKIKQVRHNCKWQKIKIEEKTEPEAGDVLWKQGHTEIYVGDVEKIEKGVTVIKPGRSYGASLCSHGPKDKGSWKNRFTYIFRPVDCDNTRKECKCK